MPSKTGSRIKLKAVPKKKLVLIWVLLDGKIISSYPDQFSLGLHFPIIYREANDHTKWIEFSNSHVCEHHCHLCEVKYPTKIQSRYSKQISLCGILYNCKKKKMCLYQRNANNAEEKNTLSDSVQFGRAISIKRTNCILY